MKAYKLLILMMVILAGCTDQTVIEPLKIGVIATLTGLGSFQGQQAVNGLELAKEEINAAGGINGKPLELIIEDSKTESAAAVTALNKLIEVDNVKFVIGDSWTSTTPPLVPVSNEKGVILISPIASLDSLASDDFFFRTMPSAKSMMDALADYAYKQGLRRVGILHQQTAFGVEHASDFKSAFEKLGGQVVDVESVDVKANDFRTELGKMNEKSRMRFCSFSPQRLLGSS